MGSREISAAWLIAAAILGLFGWLQLAGVRSGGMPLGNDLSRRAPIVASGTAGVPELAEERNSASGEGPSFSAEGDERMCNLARPALRC